MAGGKDITKSPAIPATITVGPHTYAVVVDENAINARSREEKTDLLGQHDPINLTITLRPEQAPSTLVETLLHEVLHALLSQTGIVADIGNEEEEKAVNRLAPLLLDTLRRNPALVEFLTS